MNDTYYSINNETASEEAIAQGSILNLNIYPLPVLMLTAASAMLDSTPPFDNIETPNVSFEHSESEFSMSPDINV